MQNDIDVSKLPTEDLEKLLESDTGYRRGFQHGAAQVIAAIWGNLTPEQRVRLEGWTDAVREWRARHTTEFFPPNCPKL